MPVEDRDELRLSRAARCYVWAVTKTAGFETAWVDRDGLRLHAQGRAVGQLPVPYWLTYELRTDADAATTSLTVTAATAESAYHLDLSRGANGWEIDGVAAPQLAGALDCDLQSSPLTNTMPIIRHDLHRDQAHRDFVMAFVEVPALRVRASRQSYAYHGRSDAGSTVHYNSGSFSADLLIDPDGLVIDYAAMAHRITAPGPPNLARQ